MKKLAGLFRREKRVLEQHKEITQLRSQVEKLQQQNESMREGMRRCTSCEYRIEIKKQQDTKRERDMR